MNHEKYLIILIVEANSVLEKANANTDDAIKYHYQLSRFFTIIDQIKKEICLLQLQKCYIPSDIYEEALKLLSVVE